MKTNDVEQPRPLAELSIFVAGLLLVVGLVFGLQGCDELLDPEPDTSEECCIDNAGCPSETGSECPGDCCCCPGGMRCDQSNPANGCVDADTSGGGGGGGSCGGAADDCSGSLSCCSGYTCVNDLGAADESLCAADCTLGSDCQSGCCCDLENSTSGACCPSGYCN